MPTPAQVANRAQVPRPPERHYTATVVTVGPPVMIALDPGGAQTTARAGAGVTLAVGNRVLVLVSTAGNFVIMRL